MALINNSALNQAILNALASVRQPQETWKPNTVDLRADNTPKANGFFGVLPRPAGGVSSELSVGVNLGGKETEIPLLVPTLNRNEVNYLLMTKPDPKNIPKSIMIKASDFAKSRILNGLSPFAGNNEIPYGIKLP